MSVERDNISYSMVTVNGFLLQIREVLHVIMGYIGKFHTARVHDEPRTLALISKNAENKPAVVFTLTWLIPQRVRSRPPLLFFQPCTGLAITRSCSLTGKAHTLYCACWFGQSRPNQVFLRRLSTPRKTFGRN